MAEDSTDFGIGLSRLIVAASFAGAGGVSLVPWVRVGQGIEARTLVGLDLAYGGEIDVAMTGLVAIVGVLLVVREVLLGVDERFPIYASAMALLGTLASLSAAFRIIGGSLGPMVNATFGVVAAPTMYLICAASIVSLVWNEHQQAEREATEHKRRMLGSGSYSRMR